MTDTNRLLIPDIAANANIRLCTHTTAYCRDDSKLCTTVTAQFAGVVDND